MREVVKVFTKGFIYSCLVTVIFLSCGLITIKSEAGFFLIPAVTVVIWLLVYCTGLMIQKFWTFFPVINQDLSLFIGFGFFAFWIATIATCLLTKEIVVFAGDAGSLFLIGLAYCLVYIDFYEKQSSLRLFITLIESKLAK